jgi:endonuclease/exonuclease/phosphatase family metal-dependent hydrolase
LSKDYAEEKQPGALRVMQWNCKELPGNHIGWKKNKDERKAIETFVLKYRPDVICMEDFAEHIGKKLESNYAFLIDTLGYPYKIFAESSNMNHVFGQTIVGTAIFSKQPFLRSGSLPYTNRPFPEYIVWADVLMDGEPVRLVTTHFRSMNLVSNKSFQEGKFPYYLRHDSTILRNSNPFAKVRFYQAEHAQQAIQLRAFLDTCSVPVILCADMNTVPAGFTYRMAKGNLVDGFTGSKTGMGNTYNFLLPNLRIDYLLHHPAIEARQWKHFTNGFFDHDHLMGDFTRKNNR